MATRAQDTFGPTPWLVHVIMPVGELREAQRRAIRVWSSLALDADVEAEDGTTAPETWLTWVGAPEASATGIAPATHRVVSWFATTALKDRLLLAYATTSPSPIVGATAVAQDFQNPADVKTMAWLLGRYPGGLQIISSEP